MKKLPLLLLLTLVTACVTSPTGRKQFLLVSPESAIANSQRAYASTVRSLNDEDQLLDDRRLARKVAEITGRVVTVATRRFPHSADWDWSVALIDAPETVNAWCMAGGRMAVYSGLFEKADLSDDEFAYLMGHEVAHALANHQAEQMSIAISTNVGLVAVAIATDDEEKLSNIALAAKLILEWPMSRSAEREADEIGAELAAAAGYEPAAAATLWQQFAKATGDGPPEFLSTHPADHNREADLAALAPRLRTLAPSARVPAHPVEIIRNTRTLPD